MSNIIAIVGRPNVGKSTLFNRLIGSRKAIIDDGSGITRDRHYGHGDWTGRYYTVIDTGGYVTNSDDIFEEAIRDQANLAIDEADVILFVVDVAVGITGLDQEFADILRRSNKHVLVVANKADNNLRDHLAGEFYALGFDEIFTVSSVNGHGTGDLLDRVISFFKDEGEEDPDAGIPRIALTGRPNVGKSSFLNVILGEERSIVTDIAGTTRDTINTRYTLYGKDFILIDTAGVRKKSKVTDNVEFYSVMRSVRAIEDCDVCVVMIDAEQGFESQDMNLVRLALKNRKGVVILVNKWDTIPKSTNTARKIEMEMKEKLQPNDFIPIMFISVTEKQRIFQAIEKAVEVHDNASRRVSTSKLNDALLPEIQHYPPPAQGGKYIKIKYITQLPTHNPTFAFFCNHPKDIKLPYQRFLENKLRQYFPFEGVPVRLVFRNK